MTVWRRITRIWPELRDRGNLIAVLIFLAATASMITIGINLTAETDRRADWCTSQGGSQTTIHRDKVCVSPDGRLLIPPSDSDGRWP